MLIFFVTIFPANAEDPCRDINCYFERKNRDIEMEKQKQQRELDAYRSQQLLMQEEQLNQVQRQNDLLEGQLEQLEEQNRLHEEELEALQKLQQPAPVKASDSPRPQQKEP